MSIRERELIKEFLITIFSAVLPIPGHLIVPDCFCPGRGTHTRDSGTVPGIPGQLVTLRNPMTSRLKASPKAGDLLGLVSQKVASLKLFAIFSLKLSIFP